MICKDNQQMINALLRLNDNETLCVRAINQIMDQQGNNKIASVQETTATTKKVGELAEFQALLKNYIY